MFDVELNVEVPINDHQHFQDSKKYDIFFQSLKDDIANNMEEVFEGYMVKIKDFHFENDQEADGTVMHLEATVNAQFDIDDEELKAVQEDVEMELETLLDEYIEGNSKFFQVGEDGEILPQEEWL